MEEKLEILTLVLAIITRFLLYTYISINIILFIEILEDIIK